MTDPTDIARGFFAAMQTGAAAEAEMMALFADDAVYVEPFSGRAATHSGKPAIRAAFVRGWRSPLPDITISIERVDIDGDQVTARWICRSPALPGGEGRGVNQFKLANGLIVRLETKLA
jgi:ketosteroid isomerase-like protein